MKSHAAPRSVVVTAIGALIGILTAAHYYWPGRSAVPALTPAAAAPRPTSQPQASQAIDLRTAAAKAIASIPANLRGRDADGKTLTDETFAGYRTLLSRAEPFVANSIYLRPITLAFAARLDSAQREQWLRACYVTFTDEDACGKIDELQKRNATNMQGFRGRETCAMSGLEAIYNLTQDPALKLDALSRWNAAAAGYYDRQLKFYEDARSHSRRNGTEEQIPRPALPVMPLWPNP